MDFKNTNESRTAVETTAGRYILPAIEERSPLGVSVTDPYSKSFQNRVLYLGGSAVNSVSAMDLVSQINYLNDDDPNSEITIYIHAYGGTIDETRMLVDIMQHVKAPIRTICLGNAFGAGALVLAAGNSSYALPNSRIMLSFSQAQGRGTVTNMEIDVAEFELNNAWVADQIAQKTGKTVEQVKADLDRKKFMSSVEAVEYGLIDEIANPQE